MCGRYYIPEDDLTGELQAIIDEIQRRDASTKLKRGEIFPTDVVPVLANSRSMTIRPFAMTWGYPSSGGKPIFNARSETAAAKPLFRDGLQRRRCLIPAVCYFEWEKRGSQRIKYAIAPKGESVFYMAGIYRMGEGMPTCTILTREVAPCIAFIHQRMPVILPKCAREAWLDGKNNADEVIRSALLDMDYEPVSPDRKNI